MKKVSILLFSVLALSACSQSKTDSSSTDKSAETTATSTTVVQSSSSQQMSVAQSSSQQTSSDTQDESVSYAVNLDDFTQELTLQDGSKQTIYHLKFESKQKKSADSNRTEHQRFKQHRQRPVHHYYRGRRAFLSCVLSRGTHQNNYRHK